MVPFPVESLPKHYESVSMPFVLCPASQSPSGRNVIPNTQNGIAERKSFTAVSRKTTVNVSRSPAAESNSSPSSPDKITTCPLFSCFFLSAFQLSFHHSLTNFRLFQLRSNNWDLFLWLVFFRFCLI